MFTYLGKIVDTSLKWPLVIFYEPQGHELQILFWSIILSAILVFIVEYIRKPSIKIEFLSNLSETGWHASKCWTFNIINKASFINSLLIKFPANNLKVVIKVYSKDLMNLVTFQALANSNPDPQDVTSKGVALQGVNLARGEFENHRLIYKTDHESSVDSKGKGLADFWYLPSYESLSNPKYKINSSQPSDDNEYVLASGFYYLKLLITSDQRIMTKWFKLNLSTNTVVINKINFLRWF